VATTVQNRFSASCANNRGEPSLVRKTTTNINEKRQLVPNRMPICWKSVTRPTSIKVKRKKIRRGDSIVLGRRAAPKGLFL